MTERDLEHLIDTIGVELDRIREGFKGVAEERDAAENEITRLETEVERLEDRVAELEDQLAEAEEN